MAHEEIKFMTTPSGDLQLCAPTSTTARASRFSRSSNIYVDPNSISDAEEDYAEGYYSNRTMGGRQVVEKFHCKARGLGKNHNENTAFIHVSENAKHGAVLVCSNSQCANSGRRFRYCVVCKQPVAKRNFSVRHSHGIPMTFYRGKPCWTVPVNQQELLTSEPDQELSSKRKIAPPVSSGESSLSEPSEKRNCNDEQNWMNLLHKRPSMEDSAAMSSWMKSVLAAAGCASRSDAQRRSVQSTLPPSPMTIALKSSPDHPVNNSLCGGESGDELLQNFDMALELTSEEIGALFD